jgi:hypothetical protein
LHFFRQKIEPEHAISNPVCKRGFLSVFEVHFYSGFQETLYTLFVPYWSIWGRSIDCIRYIVFLMEIEKRFLRFCKVESVVIEVALW